jgi:hypothetical protein
MKKVDRDTPEYAQEWANCAQLTEALKLAPDDTKLKAALMESAQPDYAVTGDKRSGLLQFGKLGRTRILSAGAFCAEVLRL